MTLQEAQEAIAKDYGYKSWHEIDPTNVSMDQVWKDVAFLYAESAILHTTDSYDREIKYVHQLQNLYFALTGTDLSLSPPLKIK